MQHEEYKEHIELLFYEELADHAREEAEAHMRNCAECRGFFDELKGHGHCADQFAVNVHGAAAHSRHHARALQRPAGNARQDQALARRNVAQHAQNLHLKLFNFVAFKDRAPYRLLSRPYFG